MGAALLAKSSAREESDITPVLTLTLTLLYAKAFCESLTPVSGALDRPITDEPLWDEIVDGHIRSSIASLHCPVWCYLCETPKPLDVAEYQIPRYSTNASAYRPSVSASGLWCLSYPQRQHHVRIMKLYLFDGRGSKAQSSRDGELERCHV